MLTVSDVAVSQRLPFGGDVTATVVHALTRQVRELVEKGEEGQVILEANLPLLRGAGRSAYESRYAAERELIYAVRRFERFRRSFLVDVASEYFNLQQAKASIDNTYVSYLNRKLDWEKADFMHKKGRSRSVFEAPRAKAIFRDAEAALVSAKERYESALDRFKIRLGMPVDSLLDVLGQQEDTESRALDALLVDVGEEAAVEVALRYRLDLLNSADGVDDARRGVIVAKNRILPDLAISGSASFSSDQDQLRASNLREERADWKGSINLSLDDRRAERNAYRGALVSRRRSERDHQEFEDSVRADVRRALRRIAQQDNLRAIRALSVEENGRRVEAARAQFDLGKSTNQDVVDAENDLLRARNEYAAAVAAYRVAILEFRRDTGTLRVSDDGQLLPATSLP
jgi:outer membrane protein TolC